MQDMTHFYDQYRSIKPYLMRKDDMEAGKEQLLQTVEDRAKLVLNRNIFFCILASVFKKFKNFYIHGVVILVYVYRLRIRLPQIGLSVPCTLTP